MLLLLTANQIYAVNVTRILTANYMHQVNQQDVLLFTLKH